LCFWITEANIIFKNLGSIGCNHKASKEHSDKGNALFPEAVDSWLKNGFVNLVEQLLRSNTLWSWCITSHPASIWTLIPIKDSLVVLSWRQGNDGVSIRKSENTQFLSLQKLFNNHLVACLPEDLVFHNLFEGSKTFLFCLWDNDSLSG